MATADRLLTAMMLGLGAIATQAAAADLPVDLELVLAVDASPSIGVSEFFIQRRGYVAAFRDSQLVHAIRTGHYGRVAVAYVEWAGPTSQRMVVPWALVDSLESAAAFAALLEKATSYSRLGTSISGALAYAYRSFDNNGFAGARLAIDISSNGRNAIGPPVTVVRDRVVGQGVTINGLPLMLGPGQTSLDDYYRHCVIGGPGAFIVKVERPTDFEAAVRNKLVTEVATWSGEAGAPLLRVNAASNGCDD